MTRWSAPTSDTRRAITSLTSICLLFASSLAAHAPPSARALERPGIRALDAAADVWYIGQPAHTLVKLGDPPGHLKSKFPANSTGNVETLHRLSGLSLSTRHKGLYLIRADGEQELLASPNPVVQRHDADGGVSYTDVYPGVTTRYISGPDHVRLEVFIESPSIEAPPRQGDMLQLRWQFDLENGGLIVRMPAPAGGIVLLDDERNPVVWLTEPIMPFERATKAGAREALDFVSYDVEVVQGTLEVSMTVAWDLLIREGTAFPMIVHATTLAVMTER